MGTWAAAIVFGGTESTVAQRCTDAGIDLFHPLTKKTIVKRGRRVQDVRPLLPGYLFAQVGQCVEKLLGIRGVINVVRAEDRRPLLVSGFVIEDFKQKHLGTDGFYASPNVERFRVGQQVRQREGALEDLVGIFTGNLNNAESATFSLMGRQTTVYFKQGDLVAA